MTNTALPASQMAQLAEIERLEGAVVEHAPWELKLIFSFGVMVICGGAAALATGIGAVGQFLI
jgi:hypothetical protein